MDKLKDVSVGAWALLSVIVVSLAAIVIFAPPTMWAALGKADWPHVAGVIGLIGSALVGVFVEWRKATVSVKAGPLVMLLAASLTLGMASGCGASAVQTAISAQATVLVAHHSARVEFYVSEGHRCRAASPTIEVWDVCMRPAEAVQRSADSFRDTLTAAQAALDAYGADGAKAQVACAIVAAARLVEASSAAGAPVPQEAMDVAALVTEGVCHAE